MNIRKHKHTGLFTHDPGKEIQNNILDILEYFSIWNNSAKKKSQDNSYFLPNQTWKSIRSLRFSFVGCIKFYTIVKVLFQDELILIQLRTILEIQDKVVMVEIRHRQ